jgi:digeranylgeranylglycerophospholipid reductase
MIHDVIIIGAGPAGLMAAKCLAEKDINFLIIDQKKEIGLPLRCGEGIRKEGFNELFGNEEYPFIDNSVSIIEARNGNLSRSLNLDYLQLNRPAFEKWLSENIKGHLRLETVCEDVDIQKDYAEVVTNKGVFRTKLVIIASGYGFGIQKKLGLLKRDVVTGFCYGGIFEVDAFSLDRFYFLFDDDYFGYMWIFPKKNNTVNMGLCSFEKLNCKEAFYVLLKKYGINARPVIEYGGIVPCSGPIERTYHDRLMVCGDAAGHVYAGTGEGILFALKAGHLAAGTAIQALGEDRLEADFLKKYEDAWKEYFGKHMKNGIIAVDLFRLAYKTKKYKLFFNTLTDDELKGMLMQGKTSLRIKGLWNITKLSTKKKEAYK